MSKSKRGQGQQVIVMICTFVDHASNFEIWRAECGKGARQKRAKHLAIFSATIVCITGRF